MKVKFMPGAGRKILGDISLHLSLLFMLGALFGGGIVIGCGVFFLLLM